ncbi:adipokinetic hormone/corazonin-related peptide receptor variant I-like, partial [Saccoglossus kowalevskii]|uniref:Gonadotropin-releasing hormone II receptor-like n=1 Tax=Saccoglossus kowalevskii TaxID=10224 RepID=A0ABM0MIG5_SACKO
MESSTAVAVEVAVPNDSGSVYNALVANTELYGTALTTVSLDSVLFKVYSNMSPGANANNLTCENCTDTFHRPGFDNAARVRVILYGIFFVIAVAGNLTIFITMFRNRNRRTRVKTFIMHLAIADLLVAILVMPTEAIWQITVKWYAGDAMCKLLSFLKVFPLYLSSNILVSMSLDRYWAIVHPLSVSNADKRGKVMLWMSWAIAGLCSLPQ